MRIETGNPQQLSPKKTEEGEGEGEGERRSISNKTPVSSGDPGLRPLGPSEVKGRTWASSLRPTSRALDVPCRPEGSRAGARAQRWSAAAEGYDAPVPVQSRAAGSQPPHTRTLWHRRRACTGSRAQRGACDGQCAANALATLVHLFATVHSGSVGQQQAAGRAGGVGSSMVTPPPL